MLANSKNDVYQNDPTYEFAKYFEAVAKGIEEQQAKLKKKAECKKNSQIKCQYCNMSTLIYMQLPRWFHHEHNL